MFEFISSYRFTIFVVVIPNNANRHLRQHNRSYLPLLQLSATYDEPIALFYAPKQI